MEECVRKETNADACSCKSMECERRGICCLCVASHRDKGNLPACMREIAEAMAAQ